MLLIRLKMALLSNEHGMSYIQQTYMLTDVQYSKIYKCNWYK